MRFRISQFTVQRLMIVVAVVAILLWSGQMRRRWENSRDQYEMNLLSEESALKEAEEPFRRCSMYRPTPEQRREDNAWSRRFWLETAAYHAVLKRKYARAMARPWLPVAPDPPEPQ